MAETISKTIVPIIQRYGNDPYRLMDIVQAVCTELGHLNEERLVCIAKILEVEPIAVRDMATFYSFWSQTPQGKHCIRLCNAVTERMMGADLVARAFEDALGIKFGETRPDGAVSLYYTSCIGMSDQAPSALIDGIPLTRIQPEDVPAIVDALLTDKPLKKHGQVEPNVVQAGPVIFTPYDRGGALKKALAMEPEAVIGEMNRSRLRGRGGAGFPLALKWQFCRKAKGDEHYVVCNADEGEPGTFKDRGLLTDLPDLLFEGMTIAGYAIGAKQGFLYLRGEYAYLVEPLEQVLAQRRKAGLLGEQIQGKEGFSFDIRIQQGAGAYICGEESALLESLEGKRGAPRDRPPFPVQKGYQNQPTAVNNVETLCCAARIMEKGADWFTQFGTKDSTGTKLLSISGDCAAPGIYEVEYGISVETILEMIGAPDAQAVQVGGPSGQCIAPKDYGRSIAFEDLSTGGSIIVFGPERGLLEQMEHFLEFFQEESCGWCTPCRAGTPQMVFAMKKILAGKGTVHDYQELEKIALTVKTMSRCGLGQTAGNPILSTMKNFPHLYDEKIQSEDYIPSFNLKEAIQIGCEAAGRPFQPEREA